MNDLSTILTPTLDLIISFAKVKGARFFAINDYVSGTVGKYKCIQPEIANHVVNLNVNFEGAKKKDIETLRTINLSKLDFKGIDERTAEMARMELLASLLKLDKTIEPKDLENELVEMVYNFSEDETEMSKVFAVLTKSNAARSQAQKDLYKHICNGVKVYVGDEKELKGSMKIFAFAVSKNVKTKGIYTPTNSADKTVAKNIIKKELKHTKYRNFTISKIEGNVKVNGEELVFQTA